MAEPRNAPPAKHLSGVGTARFPKLHEPDEFKGLRFFKTALILDPIPAAALIAIIDAATPEAERLMAEGVLVMAKTAKAKGKDRDAKGQPIPLKEQEHMTPYSNVMDPDTDEPTGQVVFNFKSSADQDVWVNKVKTGEKKARVIPFFDARGQPVLGKKPALWGGSKLRISFTPVPYHNAAANNYGVSLRLEAVKIIQAVVGGQGQDAAAYGMGEEEDGYTTPALGDMDHDESGDTTPPRPFTPPSVDDDF